VSCAVDGCENDAARGGLCWAHVKEKQRTGKLSPLSKRPASALERLTEAAIAYAEAEEDDEFRRARDNLRKSAAAYAVRHPGETVREALARAKAQGVRLGRPPKLTPEKARELVDSAGSIKRAAAMLGVSRRTVRRALGGSKT
jgi:hypothetical protein